MRPIVQTILLTMFFLLIIACWQGISLPQNVIPAPPPHVVPPLPVHEPGDSLAWLNYQPKRKTSNPRWGPVLTDIEQHLDPQHGNQYYSSDNITHGHETIHGINSDVRNTLGRPGQNGFYCLQNRAILLNEPRCRISDVAAVVPAALRGTRYRLYLIEQAHEWNSMPSYLFDEWIAYIAGTEVGVDQVNRGLMQGRWFTQTALISSHWSGSDDAIAPMEFTYYALAFCLTIKQKDPSHFQANPEFGEFVAFNIRRATTIYREAIRMDCFKWNTKLIETFEQSEEARPLRDLAVELWGEQFVKKYLITGSH